MPGTRGGKRERNRNPAEDLRSRGRQDAGERARGVLCLLPHGHLFLWTSDSVFAPSHQERRGLSPSVLLRGLCVNGVSRAAQLRGGALGMAS